MKGDWVGKKQLIEDIAATRSGAWFPFEGFLRCNS